MTICVYGDFAAKDIRVKLFGDAAAASAYPERFANILEDAGYDAVLREAEVKNGEQYSDCNELFDDETGEHALIV